MGMPFAMVESRRFCWFWHLLLMVHHPIIVAIRRQTDTHRTTVSGKARASGKAIDRSMHDVGCAQFMRRYFLRKELSWKRTHRSRQGSQFPLLEYQMLSSFFSQRLRPAATKNEHLQFPLLFRYYQQPNPYGVLYVFD